MAINLYSDKIEVFKFKETGWFPLFEEVLDFRRDESRHGRYYRVTYVGPDHNENLIVRLMELTD